MNTVKKRFGSNNSVNTSPKKRNEPFSKGSGFDTPGLDELSPELVPIVTLLSSQSHRRYHEGIFMLYYDLNGDGKPADREWKEVYGILTGNQLAYWDAANLAEFRNNPSALLEASSKPNYINFTDSVYNAMKVLPAAKQNLENVIIVSTTLKNRYIIQFKTYKDLSQWYIALRLANYEYSSLQQAYTGALLSARGSRLSDIKTVLAEKRFDHEDWVSIRYGSGMAWKRCYAVVEPSQNKKKNFTPGRILLYESEHKKKKQLMAVVTNASSVTAIYPQSPILIDNSTMLKLEGYINFKSPSISPKVSKKSLDDFKNTYIFLMPEEHSAVPGFDTLIRFLIPLLDSFGLYGRPTRLKADRIDPESLLFGLPTLPRVHFLEVDDLSPLTTRGDFLSWDVKQWTDELKAIMKGKLERGYEGCGSSRGFMGAVTSLNSPSGSSGSFKRPSVPTSSLSSPKQSQFSINEGSPRVQPPQRVPPPSQQQSQQPQSQPQRTQRAYDANPKPTEGHRGAGYEAESSPPYPNGDSPNLGLYPGAAGSNGAYPGSHGSAAAGIAAGAAGAAAVTGLAISAGANKSDPYSRTDAHKSVQLADIYQKYSDIKSPSDQFHTDRNQLLNGSHEKLIEDELPEGIRHMNLNADVGSYPRNDDELFSEDDDDEEKLDARQIGMLGLTGNGSSSGSGLIVPPYNNRNSSYASVKSPMTQYNEFNEQFSKVVDHKQSYLPHRVHSNTSDDDPPRSPPTPPPHQYLDKNTSPLNLPRSRPAFNSVPQGTTTPRATDSSAADYLSIHSEAGNVQSVHSSPYSDNSSDSRYYDKVPQSYQQQDSASRKPETKQPHAGHFITSPNSSQNHASGSSYSQYPQSQQTKQIQPTKVNSPQIVVAPPSSKSSAAGSFNQQGQQQTQQPARNYQSQPRPYSPVQQQGPPPPQHQQQNAYQQGRNSPQIRQYETALPSLPPQKQTYPQSSQFGYQAPPPQQSQSPQPQQAKHRQQPPQQYQQGPPPQQQYQQAPTQQQQQQKSQQYYNQQAPPASQQYQSNPQYRQAPQQSGVPPAVNYQRQPPSQYRQQPQSGIPPSVAMKQQPRPAQVPRTKSQTAANMRGYTDGSQQQYQYSYQVNSNPPPGGQQPERKPPPGPQPLPRGNPYANNNSRY